MEFSGTMQRSREEEIRERFSVEKECMKMYLDLQRQKGRKEDKNLILMEWTERYARDFAFLYNAGLKDPYRLLRNFLAFEQGDSYITVA